MIGLGVKVDLRNLDTGFFSKLRAFSKDLRPAFREMREPIMTDQKAHRSRQEGPGGRWPALAASTLFRYAQRKRSGKKPPARLLGRLTGSNEVKIERLRMTVTSKASWSGVHQHGGRAGRSLIPQRQYLWLSAAALIYARKRMLRAAKKVWS